MSSSTSDRPTWDETWLAVARSVARRSLCSRDQVGAAVVSSSNRLLETGYNGPPSGFLTDNRPCTEWCPRASSEPTDWRASDGSPDIRLEYENGKTYAVTPGGQVRQITSDETLRRMGFQPIFKLEKDYSDCPSLHAEANALMRGDRSAREGGTIYVTSHVCMGCAKLIANSGLAAVYVDSSITDPTWRQPKIVYEFLERCGIDVYVT